MKIGVTGSDAQMTVTKAPAKNELKSEGAELRATVTIKRKATGEVKQYDLTMKPEAGNGGDTSDGGDRGGDERSDGADRRGHSSR